MSEKNKSDNSLLWFTVVTVVVTVALVFVGLRIQLGVGQLGVDYLRAAQRRGELGESWRGALRAGQRRGELPEAWRGGGGAASRAAPGPGGAPRASPRRAR